jgi:hypothetical protein
MPMRRKQGRKTEVLFCPFCGEAFEGLLECPEHELELLPIDRLSSSSRGLDAVPFFLDPRLGRGPVLLGAALVFIGFCAPFARARAVSASALELAIDGAYNLWLIPLAAVVVLWILWRRRSVSAMRAVRLAVSLLAVAASLPLLYTIRRIEIMAALDASEVEWAWGLFVMFGGLALSALGSLRLGGTGD